jgi:rfaE bifunctional protein nucleotidyltransferase chain/domain
MLTPEEPCPPAALDGAAAEQLVRSAARRAAFAAECVERLAPQIVEVAHVIADALAAGGKILAFGNGGSAACAQHFAAEFCGKLALDRRPLPAIALTVDTSALTSIANDYGYGDVFARQVTALARPGDVVVGISTSGTSANVVSALAAAKASDAVTIGLTGAFDGLGAQHSLRIPLRETARVQEAHDLVLHELAQVVERILVPELDDDPSADRFPFVLAEADLAAFRAWLRRSGQQLATTNGAFDLFHRGHRASLQQARAHADRLVVLVNSDESVAALKGPNRPIRRIGDRLADLATCPAVDHVVVMPDLDPVRLLAILEPDVHAKGRDYEGRELPEAGVVLAAGGRIAYLDLLPGYSTTSTESRVIGARDR